MADHELSWLLGAQVTGVEQGEIGPKLTFLLPNQVDLNGDLAKVVEFEIWQDEEGNGPGEFALVAVAN